MFNRIDFVHMPHEEWMKNGSTFAQKWMKITTPVIARLPTLPFVKTLRVLFLPRVHCILGNFC